VSRNNAGIAHAATMMGSPMSDNTGTSFAAATCLPPAGAGSSWNILIRPVGRELGRAPPVSPVEVQLRPNGNPYRTRKYQVRLCEELKVSNVSDRP